MDSEDARPWIHDDTGLLGRLACWLDDDAEETEDPSQALFAIVERDDGRFLCIELETVGAIEHMRLQ